MVARDAGAERATDLPPLDRVGLLLDLDGTLIDFAPTPDEVVVPAELPDVLRALRHRLDDAVAVVTGRPIEAIDRLLGDAVFAVVGEHGGAMRRAPGDTLQRAPLPSAPAEWIALAADLARSYPGTLLERKLRGFALHFRLAPEADTPLHAALTHMLEGSSEFELLPGQMMWEVRPRGVNKGTGVTWLMQHAPFRHRLPVFLGDDVTDEDGIVAAAALGGVGLRVPDVFGNAAGVRAWLAAIAAKGDWP